MHSSLIRRALVTVAAVATSATLAAPAATAQSVSFQVGAGINTPCETASPADMEQLISEVHEATNRERVAAGANPVERLDSLDGIAQNWSSRMADADRMTHNPDIRTQVDQTYRGEWSRYGENVLQNWCGANGDALVAQWMRSPGHRVNMLRSDYTHLGVGAAVADSSKLYSTQNFVRLR